jgi:DNA segregation ATPase FtsK/SpoIIIE, S-DNA-T family
VLELLLRVELEAGRTADVAVELAEDHRVADLTTAVARHVGLAVPAGHAPNLSCQRLGAILEPSEHVLTSGLLTGDLVRLGLTYAPPGVDDDTRAGGLFCDVVSGPSSGTSLRLTPGRVTVGRDPACDLVLTDPTVSKRHVELVVTGDGEVQVAPAEEVTNPVLVDGDAVVTSTVLGRGALLQLGACALTVREYEAATGEARDQLGQIPFNRTPYRHPDLSEVEVRGPGKPPQPYEPRPMMWAAILLPVVGGIAFAWLLGRPEFLLFVLLSPLSMLANWWSERRRGGTSYAEQTATFDRHVQDWLVRYDEALALERHRRYEAAPDLADLARRAQLRTADLWPRNRWAEGFLQLRLGLGAAPALSATPRPGGVDQDPDGRLEAAIDERAELPSVPIVVDLLEQGVLALHGAPREVETSVGSVVSQLAILHSPDDLVLCAALHERRTLRGWIPWLPHTRTITSPLEGDHLATGPDEADDLLRRLLAVVGERDEDRTWPKVVVILDELAEADQMLVASLLETGPPVGVLAVWLGHDAALLPRRATAIVDCPPVDGGRRATLWTTEPTEPVRELDPDRVGLEAAPRIALALAPVRDASSASAAASIPRLAPLLEVLGTSTLDGSAVAAAWQRHEHRYGLPAPIGIGPTGPLVIDLVEHGPHGLVAGTSGAGKSELLQSYIAALIAAHPPTRLNLLFIDYKGGASSNVFKDVPHTVGYVTNLGADLAMRALVSLRAELDRRMRVLEGRAKDLGEMLERFPDEAPASLVIVVDEFATLVKEIPDFVAGMVDVAQRGRSLGIHLVLATQRPAGAVNDNILANTNLRISLRVLDNADSSSILGSGEAATIPAPLRGRGFAKLGAGGLVEFQSAFSGAPFTAAGGTTPVIVSSFPDDGRVTRHPEPPPAVEDEDVRTHLDVLLDAVADATARLGHQPGRRPWLEDLPERIDLDDVLGGRFGDVPAGLPGRDLVLGVVDEPAHQRQRPHTVDLEATGGLLVYGTGGSGRTTTLRTVIGSAVAGGTPGEVEVYVLDFAGRALEPVRDLPHVAAVAPSDDIEHVTRVLMHLRAEVTRRQGVLAEHRAENLTAYNAGRSDPLPRLLLLVDGYEAFERTFERGQLYLWSQLLIETVLAGRGVGLHLIATADRRISIPAALSNAISGRLLLRTADADGLTDLGVPASIARDARLGDGRAMLLDGTRIQVAVVGDELGNAAQTAALEERSRASADGLAVDLPTLPASVSAASLPSVPALSASEPYRVPVGVSDLTLATATCDVRLHHLAVVGPGESGRSTALRTVAAGLRENGVDVWVLADPTSPLADGPWKHLASRRDEQGPLLQELATAARAGAGAGLPVLVVDRAEQVGDDAGRVLEELLRDDLVRVLAGTDPTTLTGYVAGWASALRSTRRMLLLQPDDLGDLTALTMTKVQLRPGQDFPPGRGVLITGREAQLIQVAT